MESNEQAGGLPPIALNPCDLESVPEHIQRINDLGSQLAKGDLGVRLSLLKSARNLVSALETPRETMIKHCWAQPAAFIAIEIGTKIGLFKALSGGNGNYKRAVDLAEQLGIDPPLVNRLLRHLAAMGTEHVRNAVDTFPEFLEKTNYKTPTDAKNSPYQYAHNTEDNMLEHLARDPVNFERFHNHMSVYRQGRDNWMDIGFFPVEERLISGTNGKEDSAFLVDIGGSLGHDLQEFNRKYPKVPGRLILQDLPHVLEKIQDLDECIEQMPYDFFTEQPIKGSRAYFMHSVLHDWPDDVNLKILARVTEAMKPGYSKLLVYENVIPATGADWQATAEDLMVMITSSSLERSEEQWRTLLGGAGLKVCMIWRTENALESLIECELA
ncbi:hypothetical protein DL769_004728 [Monosporascus sp. CRB-8-3]|nr:hypothetical protein DL769_004728 [Monosporascus sp. CRB-8-3]